MYDKDVGGTTLVVDKNDEYLETKLKMGISIAQRKGIDEGRTQNRFAYVVDALEKVMGIKQYSSPYP